MNVKLIPRQLWSTRNE